MAEHEGVMFGQGKGLFLCGHNYKVLKNLQNARVGDKIIIEIVYGANIFRRFMKIGMYLVSLSVGRQPVIIIGGMSARRR